MRYANYQYSLTGAQQQAIQLWLRRIPREAQGESWQLLHHLTYTNSWTEHPQFEVATTQEATEQ